MDQLLNVADILAVSSRNNERDHITGLLAYADGTFIQVIEGPPQSVKSLMSRLAGDARHRHIRILGTDLSSDRAFTSWIMETPKVRPEHAALLKQLVEGCEAAYGHALRMMLDMARISQDAGAFTG
jgi:hypothetical protein